MNITKEHAEERELWQTYVKAILDLKNKNLHGVAYSAAVAARDHAALALVDLGVWIDDDQPPREAEDKRVITLEHLQELRARFHTQHVAALFKKISDTIAKTPHMWAFTIICAFEAPTSAIKEVVNAYKDAGWHAGASESGVIELRVPQRSDAATASVKAQCK